MATYRLDNVTAMTDGSGMVRFDIWALDTNGGVIPGKHKDILVPVAGLAAALALSGAERVDAVKDLLQAYAGPGWDNDELDVYADTNDAASVIVTEIHDWLDLPVEFAL